MTIVVQPINYYLYEKYICKSAPKVDQGPTADEDSSIFQ